MSDTVTFWDKVAEAYDKGSQNKGPNYAARLERAKAVVSQSDRVLDVGCASGEITLDLADSCESILGIDLGGRLIEMANVKAKNRGVANAEFIKTDLMATSLPVPTQGYDAITMYSVLHLVHDPPAFVDRLHEVLRPGGTLISETPCLGDWSAVWRPVIAVVRLLGKTPSVVHRLKRVEVEAMLIDAGFEILDSKIYNPKSKQQSITARRI